MKGNQGLEALAALCGGASKVDAGNPIANAPTSPGSQPATTKNDTMMRVLSSIPSFQKQCATALAQNCGTTSAAAGTTGTPNSSTDTHKWQKNIPQTQTTSYIPTLPNVAAILSAAGSILPQQSVSNAASQFPSTEASNAIQQLAYFNLIQNQASSTNQMMQRQTQNPCQSSAPFGLDPNAAMAIVLAVQQQAQQVQQAQQLQQSQKSQQTQQIQQNQQIQQTQQIQVQQIQRAQGQKPIVNISTSGNNAGLFPQPQAERNDVQRCKQWKQYHQIKPNSSPASGSLTVEECMKTAAPPYGTSRPSSNRSLSVPVGIHSVTSPQSGDEGQASSSGNNQANVSTPKVSKPKKLCVPSHQPILMKRPYGVDNGSTAVSTSGKDSPHSLSKNEDEDENDLEISLLGPEEKKQLKRAANRRSAQLSRKRKKQFIEELNRENDELRRKEQILRSIPDLVLVFDSAGKLWFVSHSVNHFLKYTPTELEGTSLWDRLCDESVRLLKSAFMDALAARTIDSETTPLGSGVWELRMRDKDGTHKWVVLNGVVHFSGDAPECVCSIRPRERPVSLCRKPSLLNNSLERREIIDGKEIESKVQNICDPRTTCQPSHQSVQPGARIIATVGRSVQISDSSSIISEGTSDQ